MPTMTLALDPIGAAHSSVPCPPAASAAPINDHTER